MYVKIKNLTLENGFGFSLEAAPAFPGKKLIITDYDMLLAEIKAEKYERTDLFLATKKQLWIKRFVGLPGQNDVFVQISEAAAISWLVEHGYLQEPDQFDLEELMTMAMKYESPLPIRTISIKPAGAGENKKVNEFPGHFI